MKTAAPTTEQPPCGLRTAVCLPHFTVTVMSPRPLVGDPLQKATANAVLAETLKGWQSLTPAEFMAIAAETRPAIVFALHSDLLHTASAKRQARCHQRNMAWLSTCLQLAADTGLAVFGAAHGGSDAASRRSAASEVAACNVAGFVIAGIGSEQSLQDMNEAIAASVSALPQHLPRSVQGASTPLEVLAATSNGIDLIHSSWPYELTLAGKAFTANLTMSSSSSSSSTASPKDSANTAAASVEGMVLDLHDPIYRADKLPLLEGCTCITCKQHMRAYIHHLLCAKEMVGSVLLQIHNMHHFLQFFVQIRASIEGGWSEQYHKWWLAGRPTGAAQEL
eukprot:12392-Heterococcus_DN1.PRE.2